MNYLDIIIAVPLIFAAYKGFKKGLIIELASLIGLILGIYGGLYFSDYASEILKSNVTIQEQYLPIIAFGVTFLAIVVVIYLIGKALEKVVNLVALKFVNKLAGAVFSVLKNGIILSMLILVVNAIDIRVGFIPLDQKEQSIFYPILSGASKQLVSLYDSSSSFL